MNKFDMNKTLEILSAKRPIFHNEADLQFSLAWEIQKHNPDFNIRLEYNVPGFDRRYTDIWIKNKNPIAIELKYKSKLLTIQNDDEIFKLPNHAAQPPSRYDFLKDVQRLEEIIANHPNVEGYAIMITNDSLYWKKSQKQIPIDNAFKINEGQKINGKLTWSPDVGLGTKKYRENPITIRRTYNVSWKKYSSLNSRYGEFRALCLQIT